MASAPASSRKLVEHGLENSSGANHCFLNVVIQALWNLRSFRERFLAAPEHPHNVRLASLSSCTLVGQDGDVVENFAGVPHSNACSEGCCYCAMKAVFTQYRFSEASTLPPDVLREALSSTYTKRGRFRLGEMEDATETMEALLDFLHATSVTPPGEKGRADTDAASASGSSAAAAERVEAASGLGCQPACIAHEVFGVEFVDVPQCRFCRDTGEPVVTGSFLYTVYVAELLMSQGRSAEVAAGSGDTYASVSDSLSKYTAKISGGRHRLQDLMWTLCQREVDLKCGGCNSLRTTVSERWITRRPRVLATSLVWPAASPSRDSLWFVLAAIAPELYLEQIFRSERNAPPKAEALAHRSCWAPSSDGSPARLPPREGDVSRESYLFRGLICYYGMHYIAIFWCWHRLRWIFFDDTSVREEPDWSSVANLLVNGQYVPTLLFYEYEDDVIAPRSMEMFVQQMENLEDRQSSCSTM